MATFAQCTPKIVTEEVVNEVDTTSIPEDSLLPIPIERPDPLEEATDPNVRSVRFVPTFGDRHLPVIMKDSYESLDLSFDVLDGDTNAIMMYRIVHCDWDWAPSQLDSNHYMRGNHVNMISNKVVQPLFGQPYTHYSHRITAISVSISGNYMLEIFERSEPDEVLLRRKFVIFELGHTAAGDHGLIIEHQLVQPNTASEKWYRQEVDVTLIDKAGLISNPYSNLELVIVQNQDWNMIRTGMDPAYIYNDSIVYRNDGRFSFTGLHEFRYFDTSKPKEGVDGVYGLIEDSVVTCYLEPQEKRAYLKYRPSADENGRSRYYGASELVPEYALNYMNVEFKLIMDPLADDSVFLYASFNSFEPIPMRTSANFTEHFYVVNCLVKQGRHEYLFATKNGAELVFDKTEGGHFETGNTYHVFVYHLDETFGTHRVIGYTNFESGEK